MLKSSYRRQNLLLFAASYIFYAWWDVRFLFLIVLSTYIDYCTSLMIGNGKIVPKQQIKSSIFLIASAFLFVTCRWGNFDYSFAGFVKVLPAALSDWWVTFIAIGFVLFFNGIRIAPKKMNWTSPGKFFLFWSVFVNLAILGVFKYFNFFADNFIVAWESLFGSQPTELTTRIILPVGISFFTFQTMSHTIDVYRKKIPPTDSLLELGTYVAFFPQLVAGPIERGAHLLPQFQKARIVEKGQFQEGMWLICWGLYKKIVIADNVALIVNGVFGPYDSFSTTEMPIDGIRCLIAVYAFAIQIYCDFSGYTDIARGTAKLLGFDIMLNFNLPYIAVNPSDFWQRWHISLSSWLRDYLYIPLGGNRGRTLTIYRNLMLTMILGGLWHGAAWTFVLWGAFHGLILVIYKLVGDHKVATKVNFKYVIKALIMFHLVCIGWLLFRSQNMMTASVLLKSIFTSFHFSKEAMVCLKDLIFYSWFLVLFQIIQIKTKTLHPMKRWHWFVQLNVYIFIIMSIIRLMPSGAQEFIYFAF